MKLRSLRRSSGGRLIAFACLCASGALATPLYVPSANAFVTSPSGSESIVTVNDTSGSIATAQSALNSARTANPSATILLHLNATSYSVSTTPLILGSSESVVLGPTTTIAASSSAASAAALIQVPSGSTNVSISGGTLNGAGANLNCIQVNASDRVNIASVSATDAALNLIQVYGNGATSYDNELTVAGCTLSDCTGTQSGISVHNASQAVIIDNTCSTCAGGSGIYVKDSAYCTIAGNTCTGNSVGISVGGNNNACTDNTCSANATGIALLAPSSGNSGNLCTSNTIASNSVVGISAAGTADTIADNVLTSNTATLTLSGSSNNVLPRKAALTAGQNYFYPPLIDDPQAGTIVNGKSRTDVTIGATTLSSVQTQYNSARTAHPSDVIVLHLTGSSYTGDATLTLGSYTCVLLSGTITLNSGVTGITASGASYVSVSGGTIDGGSHAGNVGLDFPTGCQMVQVDGMTLQNFGASTPRSGTAALHFASAATPILVTRCTLNQGSARGLWLEGNPSFQSIISGNSIQNFNEDGIDCDAHTSTALVKFNTCNDNLRAGIFVEQGDTYVMAIGNTLMGNHRSGLSVWNNGVGANISATEYNTFVSNLCDANLVSSVVSSGSPPSTGYGIETGSQAGDAYQEATSHNFFFDNEVQSNQGTGQQDADIGQGTLASSQDYSSQNEVVGNATTSGSNYAAPITGSGDVFYNPQVPYSFDPATMTPVGAGASVSVTSDSHTPFGEFVGLNASSTGPTLTLTSLPTLAGTYQVILGYKAYTTRGQCTISVDGHAVGGTLDQYASTTQYLTATLGTVTLSAGPHTVVMTVTGKNAGSSSYSLCADDVILVGQ